MILKDKDTKFDITITPTELNSGLRENDYWCNVNVSVKNSEIDFAGNNNIISKNELIDLIKKIEELLAKTTKYEERIVFIKNFFSLYLANGKNKSVEIKLISINKTRHNYSFKLIGDEIKECLSYIKNLDFIKSEID